MTLPEMFLPTIDQVIDLSSGESVMVAKASPEFLQWRGDPPADTFNGKPVVDYHGTPVFAEEYTLRSLEAAGWIGVWVNSYRREYLTSFAPSERMTLPIVQNNRLALIAGSDRFPTGCWDVFAWRGEEVLFAECKRKKRDKIRASQRQWLEKALAVGVAIESFLIVEWNFH